jgi:O-methyltransferase
VSNSSISLKRSIAAIVFPYREFLDRANWTSKWCQTMRESNCPRFTNREEMYGYLHHTVLCDASIDYIEFGVAHGASLRFWCALNHHPTSRFFGFDCFTGLPEDWRADHPKGKFNRDGKPPDLSDARVRFHVGLFQDSLPAFLAAYRPANRIVIHNDGDLYSSTLYTLTMMEPIISLDTIVIFDDFWDALHEYRALADYSGAYRRPFTIIAAANRFSQVAVMFYRQPIYGAFTPARDRGRSTPVEDQVASEGHL